MERLIKDAERLFTQETIMKHFIERCIQKGYIEKKHKYKILKGDVSSQIKSKKNIKPKKISRKLDTIIEREIEEKETIFVEGECEYELNIPIVPDYNLVNIEGVDYYQNIKTGMVIDTNDFGELGIWNVDKNNIDFISEDHMKFHKLNMK
jgi:hypothetical protein